MVDPSLTEEIALALSRLCESIDSESRGASLLGLGLVAPDDVFTIGAFFLLDGDVPSDSEPYVFLSPVEWGRSDERSFVGLNEYLARTRPPKSENEEQYRARVRHVFEACATAVESADLGTRYGDQLFITFSGVDPSVILENEEREFVRKLNSRAQFDEWASEVG